VAPGPQSEQERLIVKPEADPQKTGSFVAQSGRPASRRQ
jgi:hypothetical protein